jgi:hypothetical protein
MIHSTSRSGFRAKSLATVFCNHRIFQRRWLLLAIMIVISVAAALVSFPGGWTYYLRWCYLPSFLLDVHAYRADPILAAQTLDKIGIPLDWAIPDYVACQFCHCGFFALLQRL